MHRVDGRSMRWEQHRATRRRELVRSTLRAIRTHGPTVSMEQIAAAADTSKPVIYRHFGDRTGLYTAVVDSVQRHIMGQLEKRLTPGATPVDVVAHVADVYLEAVEQDPHIYRFVVTKPMADGPVDDPVASVGGRIAAHLAALLHPHLPDDVPETVSAWWAHGAVGAIWAVSEQWAAQGMQHPRADVVAAVTTLFSGALAPVPSEGAS